MPGLGALVGFASSLANYSAQQYQSDKAFAHNKALAELQNKFNIDQWNRENAYNSPMAQMNRFKMAGLNPNLIYGQQNLAANSPELVGGTPYQSPNASIVDPHAMAELDLLQAQVDNINADTKEKEAGAGEKSASAKLLTTKEMVEKSDLDLRKKLADKKIEVDDATIKEINASADKLLQETDNLKVDNTIKKLEYDYLNKTFDDRVKMVRASLNEVNSRIRLNDAQAQRITTLLDQELNNLKAEFAKIQADTTLTEQQKSNLAQQKLIDAQDNFYLKMASDYHSEGTVFGDVKAVGAEMVHLFTHILRFSLK